MALRLCPAVAFVFLVGLVDDIRGLGPWLKFAAQIVSASVAFWAGVQLTNVAGITLPPWLSLPLTVLWLVGCSNALNLIDGVDGLAAGAALFATITMLLGALLTHNMGLALGTVPLAAALLGFLRYNFNPASIFLGDAGSLTIGFVLGCYGVLWSHKSSTMLGMTAPLMAMAVPLIDTGLAIARRFLRQQPIMSADVGHIHHRLLARGLSPRKVALMLYGACGFAASLSLLSTVAREEYKGLIIIVFCIVTWVGVAHLNYVEFGVARRMLVGGAFRAHLNNHIVLQTFSEALAAATTPESCWDSTCEACKKFGFTHIAMWFHGLYFEATLLESNGRPVWSISIPLADDGCLVLTRCFAGAPQPTVLVSFAEVLHRHIESSGYSSRIALCSKTTVHI